MKTKDLNSIRNKSKAEIDKIINEKKIELMKTKADIIASREKNLKKAKLLRCDISQLLTIYKQKEIIEKLKPTKK